MGFTDGGAIVIERCSACGQKHELVNWRRSNSPYQYLGETRLGYYICPVTSSIPAVTSAHAAIV